jgi:hypothetical protein
MPKADVAELRSLSFQEGLYSGGNDDPASGDIAKGGFGYKRISDRYVREGRIDFQRATKTAWELWQKSPIAKRTLALKRDHLIGHNATPTANNPDLQKLLDDFWNENHLDRESSRFTGQLFGFGEQCYPTFVRKADGRTKIGYIDPASIEKVVKHPLNAMEDWTVVVMRHDSKAHSEDKLVYRIIREDEEYSDGETVTPAKNEGKLVTWEQANIQEWETEMLGDHGLTEYSGSCFYTKVNAVSNQARGMSDFLQVGDWIDQADDVLFSLADREQFAGYFSFDVTLVGASEEQVRERASDVTRSRPEKGSVNFHNDTEMWEIWAPDLKQAGSIETFRAILGLILGGMGFPVHWYGFGDDANRATATAQADPTSKSLEHDQGIIRDMFLHMCQFAVDQADIAGKYTPSDDDEITLSLPEVQVRDLSRITASMQALTISLVNGVDAGWITQETAAEAFAKLLAELDIQVDVTEELKQIGDEDEAAELDAVGRANGQLQRAMVTNEEN